MCYYEEPYYEQTIGDDIFNEAIDKLKEGLNVELKNYIEEVKSKDVNLLKREEELRNKKSDIANRERRIEHKERELERNFNKEKFSNLLKPLVGSCFEVIYKTQKAKKCKKCDDKRMRIFKDGKDTIKQECSCNINVYLYYTVERNVFDLSSLFFSKSNRWNKPVTMRVKFNAREQEDEEYCSFNSDSREVLDKFTDETKELRTYNLTYSTIEEAQKHCDYLNRNNK